MGPHRNKQNYTIARLGRVRPCIPVIHFTLTYTHAPYHPNDVHGHSCMGCNKFVINPFVGTMTFELPITSLFSMILNHEFTHQLYYGGAPGIIPPALWDNFNNAIAQDVFRLHAIYGIAVQELVIRFPGNWVMVFQTGFEY
ncbi:hypothetical protein NP233_g10383 [Leucocoprinus birnbaumii]|uniref:Uncharacterized protein n=1 Tax=Leucocoprinus birnbaumii TaxID=56174 RepID=A0AAD5VM52_9AGAR|nr:hypothetical protein NP233_g10383 [Leucocoprinus birnbaumii]